MFLRKKLNTESKFSGPIFHRSPLQTIYAARMHSQRAEKLAPGLDKPETPYITRRKNLSARAADKASDLFDLANKQDKHYQELTNKGKAKK